MEYAFHCLYHYWWQVIFMFTMLFGTAEFRVAGCPACERAAMSCQTVFQLSVPIAFTFQNGVKVEGNLLGIKAKRNEKSLILLSLKKFHVTYMKSEWLYVAAGWAFCSVGWSTLQYFILCKCSHAPFHSVELRAFIITCWSKKWTEHKLKCKKCHLNIRNRYFMVRVSEHWSMLPRELVESLPLGMFRRSSDLVLGNLLQQPLLWASLDWTISRGPLQPQPVYHAVRRTSANTLLSLRIKYTFGQAKDNDPQIVKNLRVMKGSHTQKPECPRC